MGCVAMRISAAASPPRICGPLERTISPYQPACAAASRSRLPAVITPAPPEPHSATQTLVRLDEDFVVTSISSCVRAHRTAVSAPLDSRG